MRYAVTMFVFVAMEAAVFRSTAAEAVQVPPNVQKWIIQRQQIHYPAAARARRATGAGIFVMRIQIKTGRVKAVDVARTTGDSDLDAAAVEALKQWRFQPGVLPSIKETFKRLPRDPLLKDPFATEDSLIKIPVNFSL